MKGRKGASLVVGSILLSALIWYIEVPQISIPATSRWSFVLGGVSLTGFCLVFLLSARLKRVESWFNGLEHVYIWHKYLAIFSTAAVFAHAVLLVGGSGEEHGPNLIAATGLFALLLFALLILIALVAKRMKYERWRFFHRIMVIPYGLGVYHTYLAEEYNLFQLSGGSLLMGVTTLVGTISAIYVIFFYQRVQFQHTGSISSVKKLSPTVVELGITLNRTLEFEPGQYLFLKINQKGFDKAPHPFSISGGDGVAITVAIKTLGDHTDKLYTSLKVGTKISVDGSYGHMIFNNGELHQTWIAGGIGIAPFISYLRTNGVKKHITLYYSYRGEQEGIYKEYLQDLAGKHENFNLILHDTAQQPRLDFAHTELPQYSSVFMCGPGPMIQGFARQLKKQNRDLDIVYEAFDFR